MFTYIDSDGYEAAEQYQWHPLYGDSIGLSGALLDGPQKGCGHEYRYTSTSEVRYWEERDLSRERVGERGREEGREGGRERVREIDSQKDSGEWGVVLGQEKLSASQNTQMNVHTCTL